MKNYLITLLILILAGSAIFAGSKFYHSKTTAPEIVSTATPVPDDFINQSSAEINRVRPDLDEKTSPSGEDKEKVNPVTPGSVCSGTEYLSFVCYEKYYENLVKTKGIPAAFADIKVRENQNTYIKSQCHPLSHSIGHAAAGLFSNILDAFKNGDGYCWSGYYHGVLEEIIDTKGKEKTLAELNIICSEVPGKATYSFDYYNCVHGLGHGLMATAGQNLFTALTMCDNLEGGWEKSSCHSGVFMENIIIENKGGSTEYLRPAEPIYPCSAVGANYKQICYLMQTSYMLKVSGNDFSKVFNLCSQVENPFQTTCYQSLGRDASGQSSSDVEKTKNTCYLGQGFEQRSNCMIGAVRDFVSYYHSDVEAKNFCNALTEDLKNLCIQITDDYYRTF